MRNLTLCIALLFGVVLAPRSGECARLKDVADIEGVRSNQLLGYHRLPIERKAEA